ncbi:MAG: hypothetical protein OXC57_06490, partial [Rhodobacteraceae bacterium]|nr:hypothetical protein [Paracoccaceae bacterium]
MTSLACIKIWATDCWPHVRPDIFSGFGSTRFTHFLQGRVPSAPPPMTGEGIAGQGAGPSVGVGTAQGPPLGGVSVIIIPDARPSAQAVANVLEGPGADREAAACGVGHVAGLAALVRRRVGATRHEAAPQ